MILLLANLEKIFGGWRSWRLLTYCLACGVQWIKFPAVLWVFRSTASFGLTYLVWVTPVGALGYLMICPQKLVLAFEVFAQQEHDTVLYVKFVELIQNLCVLENYEWCCFHCVLASLLPNKCQINWVEKAGGLHCAVFLFAGANVCPEQSWAGDVAGCSMLLCLWYSNSSKGLAGENQPLELMAKEVLGKSSWGMNPFGKAVGFPQWLHIVCGESQQATNRSKTT